MGYDVWIEGEITLSANKLSEALPKIAEAIAESNGYSSFAKFVKQEEPVVDILTPEGLEDWLAGSLEDFTPFLDTDSGEFTITAPEDSTRSDEEDVWIIKAMAPFLEEGAGFKFKGEDGCSWQWAVRKGKLENEYGETLYGPDAKAPEVIQQIVDLLYPDNKSEISLEQEISPDSRI